MDDTSEAPRPLPPHRLYVHIAWSTLARVPAIAPERRAAIETHMLSVCRRLGVEPVEARALGDRVHLLVRLPSTISVTEVASAVREDVTARLAHAGRVVRWTPGFAAVSVSPAEVRRAKKRLASLEDVAAPPPRRRPKRRDLRPAGLPSG